MRKSNIEIYSFLNKHYENLKTHHPDNFRVESWIDDCVRKLNIDKKKLFICTRCFVHWSEGYEDRLQDGQVFKSFYEFRGELIKRDVDRIAKMGTCAGYDKVKFSVVGIVIDIENQEVSSCVLTDRIDLGDGIFGIDSNIDLLNWFRKKDFYIVPTLHDLKNLRPIH